MIAALGRDMIPHRGPAFRALYSETLELARDIHRTDGDVLTWAATGSAGWEVAVVNLLSPGDAVLVAVNGNFGERFARVAERLGIDVRRMDVGWGDAILPEQLRLALETHPDVRAVFLVHNETSTGVTNPLRDLAAIVRDHGALVVVDAVSAAELCRLRLMPGASTSCSPAHKSLDVSTRALDRGRRAASMGRAPTLEVPAILLGHDRGEEIGRSGLTPTTPPLSMIYAFRAALGMIADEGIEHVWERHRRLGAMTRDGIAAAGLRLFARQGLKVTPSRRSYRLRMSPPESCWRCCAATTASRLRVGKRTWPIVSFGWVTWAGCTSRRCARQSMP